MYTTTRTLFLTILCLALLAAPALVATGVSAAPAAQAATATPTARAAPAQAAPPIQAATTPTFNIIAVTPGVNVTIQAANFPARTSFDAYMGPEDTKAVGGTVVGQVTSGVGGSFTATFRIPPSLKTTYKIGLRLQAATAADYYVYNWFYNDRASGVLGGDLGGQAQAQAQGVPAPGSQGLQPSQPGGQQNIQPSQPEYPSGVLPSGRLVPTISIAAVNPDSSVTITTYNFPANDIFEVLLGQTGTRGIGGISAGRIDSGKGGTQSYVIKIPPALYGQYAIAIRLQSITGRGYYAYNWFNNVAGYSSPGKPGTGGIPGYYGFPTFSIISVGRNTTVNVQAYNLPPNKTFQVRMGPMGTRGIGGYVVGSFDTGAGGMQSLSFSIPAPLYGSRQIAIRMQATDFSGFYAYNWFYNN